MRESFLILLAIVVLLCTSAGLAVEAADVGAEAPRGQRLEGDLLFPIEIERAMMGGALQSLQQHFPHPTTRVEWTPANGLTPLIGKNRGFAIPPIERIPDEELFRLIEGNRELPVPPIDWEPNQPITP